MAVTISIDAKVVTSDGKELGRVKKVEESAFLVDASLQFDYWLGANLAKSATAQAVELTIAEADVAAYKMDKPHDHNEFMANPPKELSARTVQGNTLRR